MQSSMLLSVGLSAILFASASDTSPSFAAENIGPVWTIPLYSEATLAAATPPDAVRPEEPVPQLDGAPMGSAPPWISQTYYSIGLFGELVEVPALKGKTWSEASTLLAQKNLVASKAGKVARNDDVVRNQNVVPGKKVFPGTEVRLFLVAKVPNVVGMTLSAAFEVLEAQNDFPMKYNPDWPSDLRVTVQDPKAGALHGRGRDVEVASMVKVPKLRGITVEAAKDTLTASNLYAEVSTEFFLDQDRVLRQTPREGKMVPALSKVTLVPGAEVPDLIGLTPADADRALRPTGILGRPVYRQVATFDSFAHGQTLVENQSIRSGNYVARGTRMRVNLVQYVYRQQVIIIPTRPETKQPQNPEQGMGGLEGGGGG